MSGAEMDRLYHNQIECLLKTYMISPHLMSNETDIPRCSTGTCIFLKVCHWWLPEGSGYGVKGILIYGDKRRYDLG